MDNIAGTGVESGEPQIQAGKPDARLREWMERTKDLGWQAGCESGR